MYPTVIYYFPKENISYPEGGFHRGSDFIHAQGMDFIAPKKASIQVLIVESITKFGGIFDKYDKIVYNIMIENR